MKMRNRGLALTIGFGLGLGLTACATAPTAADVRRAGQRGDTDAVFDAWSKARTDAVRVAVLETLSDDPKNQAGARLVRKQATTATARPVRLAALRALSVYDGPETVRALLVNLGHPWPEARGLARAGLESQGDRAQDDLLGAVRTSDSPWVRSGAVRLLVRNARLKPGLRREVAPVLEQVAQNDGTAEVREAAVKGLGGLRVASARALLGELAKTDADGGVRMAASKALTALGPAAPETEAIVAVLPLRDDTDGRDLEVSRLARQLEELLRARLSASKVCKVVDRSKIEAAVAELRKVGKLLYDGDAPNAPDIGAFKIANQLVYGSVQRQSGVFTVVLNRMRVDTSELVPGAAVTVRGYRADLDQLKTEAAEQFVRKFR